MALTKKYRRLMLVLAFALVAIASPPPAEATRGMCNLSCQFKADNCFDSCQPECLDYWGEDHPEYPACVNHCYDHCDAEYRRCKERCRNDCPWYCGWFCCHHEWLTSPDPDETTCDAVSENQLPFECYAGQTAFPHAECFNEAPPPEECYSDLGSEVPASEFEMFEAPGSP